MPDKLQSWMLSIGTEHGAKLDASQSRRAGAEQDAEQGTGISTNLYLENFRNLANTHCCVDVSKYAANENTKWAAAPQLDRNTQAAKLQSGCN